MTPAQRIVRHYGGDWHGSQGNIPGHGHSKHDRSVSIKDAPDRRDGVLVCVRGAGDWKGELDRFRRDGLLPAFEAHPRREDSPSRPRHNSAKKASWSCTGTYEYDDGAGNVIYRTRRLEAPGRPKRFVAERLENGGWVNGLGDTVRLPYRFTELCMAAERARGAGQPEPLIYFVEGERKADKLASWGLLATAVAFGASGWRESYGEAFGGATVVILPDNDDPGRKFATAVKAGIEGYGGAAHILELPGLPPKGDIIDWTGTAEDLRHLTHKLLSGGLLPIETLDLAALATVQPRAKTFAVERLAPLGEVTLFTGPGSAGKSLLGQQLATCAAAGLPCLGLAVAPGPAIYLTCEDDADQLHWRQAHLSDAMHAPMGDLHSRLHLISLRGALDNDLGTFNAEGTLSPSPAYHRLVAMILATGAKLVVLDNVAHLFTGNENDRGNVTRFVNLLNRLAGETGAAILLLSHPNKSGDSYSGSTAWLNAVRSQITIDHERDSDGSIADPDMRLLTIGKANYTRKGEALRFRWHDWAFVLEDDLPADTRAEIAEVARLNRANAAFHRCLAAATAARRAVSHNPGTNYAPKIFAGMPEGKGFAPKALAGAMERLLHLGEIELDALLWQDAHRHWKQGIKAVEKCGDPPAATPCGNLRRPPIDSGRNACGTPRAATPLYTTYSPGAAPSGSPAPDGEPLDRGDPELADAWTLEA